YPTSVEGIRPMPPSTAEPRPKGVGSLREPNRSWSERTTVRSFWERIALAVWLVVLLGICSRLLVSSRSPGVYPIFAGAARHWLAGEDLYRPGGEPYRYSPLVAICFVPFSVLPDPWGGILWRLLNAGVFLGGLAWWCRVVLPVPITPTRRAILFLLVVPLALGSLNNGQSNALVLGLLLASGAAGAARRRDPAERR